MARAHPAPFPSAGPVVPPLLAAHHAAAGPENPPPLSLPAANRQAAAAGGAPRPLARVVRRGGGQRCPFESDAAARRARRQRLVAAAERSKAVTQELLQQRLQAQAETERLLAASREGLADINGRRIIGTQASARAALVAATNGWRKLKAGPAAAAAALPVPGEIYEALKVIPNLDRADLLRGYSALVRDERRFRGLMALPMDMRKEWLLMEIEGNQ